MYPLIRSALFKLPPEQAHRLILGLMTLVGKMPFLQQILRAWYACPNRHVQAFGLDFSNPIGLAAGYDKDATAWRGLACLGFGHIELGTVTLLPQKGNPQPRLFRHPEQEALINRLGFPGKGATFVAKQIQGVRPPGLILGVNLGKSVDTPLQDAALDYVTLMELFQPLADYLVINISSPNTLGLRQLQAKQALQELLQEIHRVRQSYLSKHTPILIKLSPDLNDQELDDALDVITANRMDGVVATNTTVGRESVHNHPLAAEVGGLSGAPLRQVSTRMVQDIYRRTGGKLPIIGVGGVMDAESAKEKLDAGACLVQMYTGLVYKGPGIIPGIVTKL